VFKYGDKVKCVAAKLANLIEDEIYIVSSVVVYHHGVFLGLEGHTNAVSQDGRYSAMRFELYIEPVIDWFALNKEFS
jgi:hypothetical protein